MARGKTFIIKQLNQNDLWAGLSWLLVGKKFRVSYMHESLFYPGFVFATGELEDEVCGAKTKTFLAVKLETDEEWNRGIHVR